MESPVFRHLIGRAATDHTPEVRDAMMEIVDSEKILSPVALRRACPELSETEFHYRFLSVIGVMVYFQADIRKIQTAKNEDVYTDDPDTVLKYIMPFLVAGMKTKPVDELVESVENTMPYLVPSIILLEVSVAD